MKVSSLVTFSVLALVAPVAAAPQILELVEINGTSTRIIDLEFTTRGATTTYQMAPCNAASTKGMYYSHTIGQNSSVAGIGVVPAPTTSLPSYKTPLLGPPKISRIGTDSSE